MTIPELVNRAKRPDLAKILIMDSLSLDEKSFFLKRNQELAPTQTKLFLKSYRRLEAGEPVQYITGTANFYGREFKVNKNVLIPRPETEILVQKALEFLELRIMNNESWRKTSKLDVIDVGTGSGCVTVSLAKELETKINSTKHPIRFYASDISPAALKVAKQNAKTHGTKINFIESDLLLNKKIPGKFDLILANLPYLRSNYRKELTQENHSITFEPIIALDGGQSGLEIVKALISDIPNHLAKNGIALLEVGNDQEKSLRNFAKNFDMFKFEYLKDLTGRFRFLKISKIN